MNRRITDSRAVQRQRGVAMVMSLALLVIMTLLAVSAMRATMMQERMAGGMQDNARAFQAAETALRAGERALSGASPPNFPNEGDGLYISQAGGEPPDWEDIDASPDSNGAREYSVSAGQLARDPQYYIQRITGIPPAGASLEAGAPEQDIDLYRVRARGFGATENTVVVLESMFRRD